MLDEGTILYDGKWYHKKCWNCESVEYASTEIAHNVHVINFTELFEQLYQSSPDMYRVIDKDGIITLCNNAYAKYLGYSVNEVIGRSIFDHVAKESILTMQDSFETWKSTGIVKNREVWFQRKDKIRNLNFHLFPQSLELQSWYQLPICQTSEYRPALLVIRSGLFPVP